VHHAAVARLESMGHDVGCRLTERLTQARLLLPEPLDAVKFICKDFWSELFRKQVRCCPLTRIRF
jgi:trafficking protein particle complex subunit 6